jgi:hypothetical protein
MDRTFEDFTADAPPAGLSPALEALWWLGKGGLAQGPEWQRAHALTQGGSAGCDRVHALVHWIEGDDANADYWWRRAGSGPQGADIEAEWAHQVAVLRGA